MAYDSRGAGLLLLCIHAGTALQTSCIALALFELCFITQEALKAGGITWGVIRTHGDVLSEVTLPHLSLPGNRRSIRACADLRSVTGPHLPCLLPSTHTARLYKHGTASGGEFGLHMVRRIPQTIYPPNVAVQAWGVWKLAYRPLLGNQVVRTSKFRQQYIYTLAHSFLMK